MIEGGREGRTTLETDLKILKLCLCSAFSRLFQVWKAIANVRMNTSNPKIARELRSQRVQYGRERSAWTSVSAFHTATNSFLMGQERKTVDFWALMAYPLLLVFETYGIYPAHAYQQVWTWVDTN